MPDSVLYSLPQLLDALSDAVGHTLRLQEDEECILEFDDEVDVVLARSSGKPFVSFRAAVTPDGQTPSPETLQHALSLNYTSMPPGCVVALDEWTRQLLLVALVDFEITSPERFVDLAVAFLQLVQQVRKLLDDDPAPMNAQLPSAMATGARA